MGFREAGFSVFFLHGFFVNPALVGGAQSQPPHRRPDSLDQGPMATVIALDQNLGIPPPKRG
jgi:hypothetical protein